MITAAFYRETEDQEPGSLKRRARGGDVVCYLRYSTLSPSKSLSFYTKCLSFVTASFSAYSEDINLSSFASALK